MDQTIQFNNNGVQFLAAGYFEEAKDLFQAALELKLAQDRAAVEGCTDRNTRCVTPEGIFVAEYHLMDRSKYFSRPRKAPGSLMSLCMGGFTACCSNSSTTTTNNNSSRSNNNNKSNSSTSRNVKHQQQRPRGERRHKGTSSSTTTHEQQQHQSYQEQHYQSYQEHPQQQPLQLLYAQAFPILESDVSTATVEYVSAINIFNLGLVHQLEDPSSSKARVFYEVAASLLAMESWGERSALIRAALMNNFAIFAYQNNESEAALDSLEQLGRMLASWPGEPEQAAGFQSNLALLDYITCGEDDEDEDDEDDSDDDSDNEEEEETSDEGVQSIDEEEEQQQQQAVVPADRQESWQMIE